MSNKNYIFQKNPFRVPAANNKIIEEHIGLASTHTQEYSLAHMHAPPSWTEPFQNPEFDEITILVRGRMLIEVDDEQLEIKGGESILIKKGARVRYSNPYEEENEYWSVCVPAFDINTVNREE